MASGSFVKYIRSNKEYIKVWWSSSPVSGENKSKVTVYAKMYRPYTIESTADKDIALTINGTTYNSTKKGWGGKGWTTEFAKKTVTISHDSDGKKTIKIKLKVEVDLTLSGKHYASVTTDNTSCKLDNLTVKSSISLSPTTVTLGSAVKVALSRSSSTVRHQINCKIGTKTYTILSKANDNGSTSSYSYTLSPANFLPYMSGQSASVTVTCTTYKSASGASLGSVSKTFTVKIRSTDKPSLTDSNVTLSVAPISPNTITTQYIQGKAAAKITISPTLTAGSSGAISTYKVAINGTTKNYSSSPITTTALTSSGTNTIKVAVIDKRGMISDIVTKTITVLPYSVPLVSGLSVIRCNADGTENKSGTSVKVTAQIKYSDCGGNNKLTLKFEEKNILDSSYTVKDTLTNQTATTIEKIYSTYPVDNSYDFKLSVTDVFGATTSYLTDVGTEELLIDFSPNSVGIGKVVERENALEVGWDSYFSGTIHGTVQTSTSDARYKDIIGNIDEDILLNLWRDLQIVLFRYNDNYKINAGVIAQDVIALFDSYGLDWQDYAIVYGSEETAYSVNYQMLNMLTLHIVQTLCKRVTVLEEALNI